jgi:glycosyltransferase involved in cell wall biosynthesis
MSDLTVVVEGWRFLPHSYAIVSQCLSLEFLRQPGLRLFHRDLPAFKADWTPQRGLMSAASEAKIAAIPPPPADLVPDVVFRCAFPYDLTPARARRTFVQMTAELGMMPDQCMTGGQSFARAIASSNATIVTPSAYCRDGLAVAGADTSRVEIVPHGVDVDVFAPLPPEERARVRNELRWNGQFVFLNVGAMTDNKGRDLLLSAFASVARQAPNALLCIKALDGLYNSGSLLAQSLQQLQLDKSSIISRIRYDGGVRGAADMASLYAAADAYVSPYLAEGFNIPVLEAASCGLPVICTAGGPTDEFVTDDFARRIPARRGPSPWGVGESLTPDLGQTVSLMQAVMQDAPWRRQAAIRGAAHVRESYTWARAAQRMLALFSAG